LETVKKVGNYWYPDSETGLPGDIASLDDIEEYIVPHCAFGDCIQAGGAVGAWAAKLSNYFDHVYSFEPNPELRECFVANCGDIDNITLSTAGLWSNESTGTFRGAKKWNMGSWHIEPGNQVPLHAIDAYGYMPSLIMLDIEGAELHALMGAVRTIREHEPVIVVETKESCLRNFGHSISMLEEWLKGENYVKKETFHGGRDQLWIHK
jgi:FkbM family methyltransferase